MDLYAITAGEVVQPHKLHRGSHLLTVTIYLCLLPAFKPHCNRLLANFPAYLLEKNRVLGGCTYKNAFEKACGEHVKP